MLLSLRFCSFGGVVSALTLAGCQSYTARPLDLDAHAQAVASRAGELRGVGELARRLDAASGVMPPTEFDPADGLTLAEGEAVALVYNPQLRVARLKAGVALATARTAGLWEDPEFGFDLEHILSGVDNPWVVGATLSITLPISGRLDAEKTLASTEHRAAIARVTADEWHTRTQLRQAWLEWSAYSLRAAELRELLARLDDIGAVAVRLEDAGEMSRPDASLFRIERATKQNDLLAVESQAQEAELAVKALLGLTPDAPVQLVPQAARSGAMPEREEATRLLRNSPTLGALEVQHQVAEDSLKHEVRKQYPDLTIGPGAGSDEGDSRVLLGLSLPIPLWNQNKQGVAEALAQRDLARAEYETEYESLTFRLASAELRLRSLTAQRQELEAVVVPMVDAQYADVRRLAEAGDFSALLTREAIVRLHDVRLRLIDARLEESLATVRIEELLGPVVNRIENQPASEATTPADAVQQESNSPKGVLP